jgi:hypothetical protein
MLLINMSDGGVNAAHLVGMRSEAWWARRAASIDGHDADLVTVRDLTGGQIG